jgi:hypothetical protein
VDRQVTEGDFWLDRRRRKYEEAQEESDEGMVDFIDLVE